MLNQYDLHSKGSLLLSKKKKDLAFDLEKSQLQTLQQNFCPGVEISIEIRILAQGKMCGKF